MEGMTKQLWITATQGNGLSSRRRETTGRQEYSRGDHSAHTMALSCVAWVLCGVRTSP